MMCGFFLASICAAVHSLAAVQQSWLLLFADFSVSPMPGAGCVQAGVSGTQDRDKQDLSSWIHS